MKRAASSLDPIMNEPVLPAMSVPLHPPAAAGSVAPEVWPTPDDRSRAAQARIAELEAILDHRERQIQAIQRTSEALFQHTDLDEVVKQTLLTALEVLGADAGSLLLHDPQNDTLVFRYVVGPAAEKLTGYVMPAAQGIAGKVFSSAEADLTHKVSERADFNRTVDEASGYRTESMMTVPVKRPEGAPIGVMQVLNGSEPQFGHRDLEVLQALCAQAAAAIETARLEQEARKAEIVNIIGDISHDIKNMLTPIQTGMWTLQPMLERLFANMGELIKQCEGRRIGTDIEQVVGEVKRDYGWIFQGALEACEQVQARTKEIADCVKGELAPPVFEELDLNDLARDLARPLGMLANSHGVKLLLNLDENLPRSEFDRKQIYNALYNLINNAIPETPPGGTITLRTCAPGMDGLLLVEVQDTGRGIPPHVRERMFTDQALSTKEGGTGLGTRIVAGVVERHHGSIAVQSEEGYGSTFSIRLPLRQKRSRPETLIMRK